MAQPHSPVHEEIGRRIRRQRDVLGLTQEDVSERSALHVSYVARVERGERNVGVENLLRIADALDIDPGELISGLRPPRR